MVFGLDAQFSEESLIQRVNADLANNLGNCFSRTLTMIEKYCGGCIPEPGEPGPEEQGMKDHLLQVRKTVSQEVRIFTRP
jgi:methionyl-tRNA synthetase